MARERVVINIEVNSDVATIEATRQALERLTRENNDLNDSYERNRRTLREVTKENKRLNRDSDLMGNTLRRLGRSTANATSRWAGFGKKVFDIRKDIGSLISAFGGLIKIVNKLSIIEIPLLAAGMATITLLFKSGTGFVNMYRAAMSSLAYAAAGVGVAVTTAVAAVREFQSVQFAPMYVEGAVNTSDRFVAASQAMKMFIDNTRLAVVGSESLGKAFGTLSKQSPVTGGTVAAFEGLMNVVAGSGGDIGKGAENLAAFLAQVQKSGLGGAGEAAKALGSDFEKIIKEARALGIDTQEEFFKAAAEGTLGETFQAKYAGQLNALNDTLFGRFKTAFASIKGLLQDLGDTFLQPAGEALIKIQRIIERTILQLGPMLKEFGTETFLADVVNLVDKTTSKFVALMNRYLGTAPGIFEYFGNVFDKIGRAFEKVQDWARQFVDAGQVIIDNFIEPIWDGLMDKFGGGMNTLATLVEENAPLLRSLADSVVGVIGAIGDYANMLKEAFIAVIPLLNVFLKVTEKIFSIWTTISKSLLNLFGGIGGGFGKALAAVPILYASLTLAQRFFSVLGQTFGKNMNIRANQVNVYGGGGLGGGPVGGGGGRGGLRGRLANSRVGRIAGSLGLGNMAMMAGGSLLMGAGQMAGGTSSAGGAALTAGGTALNAAGMLKFLGGVSTGTALGFGAIGGASYGAGSYIGSKFSDDSIRSRGTAALAGAGSGALIGAAVGSFVPVIGTGVGAAIGAVVGGVSAYMKAGSARKNARKAAQGVVDTFLEETNKLFEAGDTEGLKNQLAGLNEEIAKAATGDIDTYNAKIKELQPQIDATAKRIETFTNNASLAERAFNLSSDALNKLTAEAGIDPQTQLLTYKDILQLVGKTAEEQARIMKSSWSVLSGQSLGSALGRLDRVRQRRQTGTELDAAQAALAGGATSEEALLRLIETQIKFSTTEYGDLGGMANAYQTIVSAMQGEELGFLDQATKGRLMQLTKSILDPSQIVKDMDPQALADLLGGESNLKNMTPDQIVALVNERMKNDPTFLANLSYAQISGNVGRMNQLTAPIMGPTLPSGFMPQASQGVGGTANVVVNVNAPVIDPAVVKKIEDQIKIAIRTAQEKGGSFVRGAGAQ